MSSVTHSRSVLHRRLLTSSAPALATTTSADFSLRHGRRPFRHKARSPQVRVAHLHRTTAASTPPRLAHKGFAVSCPLALLGSAFYAVLVHRLAIYAPRLLPTLGHPHAVALHFAHCDQLAAGLAPAGVLPCWAHTKKRRDERAFFSPSTPGRTAPGSSPVFLRPVRGLHVFNCMAAQGPPVADCPASRPGMSRPANCRA